MTAYDVFNGDADGLCALQQWRLADPAPSTLVTGVKRDIQLLRRVFPQPGDAVTVMDVSLDVNREDLLRILDAGAEVTLRLSSHPTKQPRWATSGYLALSPPRPVFCALEVNLGRPGPPRPLI